MNVFGVDATATALVSERDQNVKLVTVEGSGFVLKIGESRRRPRA